MVYVHGYASLLNINAINQVSTEDLKIHLYDVGVGIINK